MERSSTNSLSVSTVPTRARVNLGESISVASASVGTQRLAFKIQIGSYTGQRGELVASLARISTFDRISFQWSLIWHACIEASVRRCRTSNNALVSWRFTPYVATRNDGKILFRAEFHLWLNHKLIRATRKCSKDCVVSSRRILRGQHKRKAPRCPPLTISSQG